MNPSQIIVQEALKPVDGSDLGNDRAAAVAEVKRLRALLPQVTQTIAVNSNDLLVSEGLKPLDASDVADKGAEAALAEVKWLRSLLPKVAQTPTTGLTRKRFVGGNWKSNGTKAAVAKLVKMFNGFDYPTTDVDVVVAPTWLHIDYVQKNVTPNVQVASQNIAVAEGKGAYTGEVTAAMLKEYGLQWCIVGHSERRSIEAESDTLTAMKAKKAIDAGLNVIICCGEQLADRKAGLSASLRLILDQQLNACVKALNMQDWSKVVIAYEPVWAIGTGLTASPAQAQEVHNAIRLWLMQKVSFDVAASTRIIYGGSVKGSNAASLLQQADIDGFLVGGASLKPDFSNIIGACRKPTTITKVHAREIIDSRGNPTVEVDVHTNKGMFRASVPSGASTGIYEACELRDQEGGAYIADLAVGLCTGQIKTGAPCRSERLSKYNQLLRIEEELGDRAIYAGANFRKPAWMGDPLITKVHAREIIDSRGNPTVEVDVTTTGGMFRASVPSGASTGIYEACELRDQEGGRYLGKGVKQAVANVKSIISPALIGKNACCQREIDQLMLALDGTPNKTKLGANAILGVSLAVAKAGAAGKDVPLYQHFADLAGNPKLVLPVPSFNVINGGSHAGNKLAFQEFMIMPIGCATFKEAMQVGAEVYHNLKKVIKEKYGQDATNVGDEGGFAPNIQSNKEGVELLMEARKRSGHEDKVVFAMDVAASEFYKDGKYDLDFKNKDGDGSQVLTGEQLMNMYRELASEYPIMSIEDPFDQDDWPAYTNMTAVMGTDTQIVGDDLLVTNPKRIQEAKDRTACNALLLKVNQIGSVSEAIDAVKMAKQSGWGVMTSHRSGETEDCYIADLAVGLC
eukprot:CAMPEP_0113952418 /NCGR_PEP_ID=MMETSP1339-20121228/90405_1 /TAXON_ID=94617 /ORGANISM="Fibrocapsa japonica" /LENGTH=854 /DNA_ID=CAMNT_0000961029 /DNA_START=6 /DNA_END=2566 /DNA_ORIENTATION=- /assembly_acc=CAM_ASM_000762